MIAELSSAQSLLEAQVAAGMEESDVKEQMCRSWMSRISCHPALKGSQKSALTSAITAGPWDPHQRKNLAAAVLANGVRVPKHKGKDRRQNQKAHNIENLLSMELMMKLKDAGKYSLTSRLSLLASHAKTLGIENPDNGTLFRMVSIVAWCDPKVSFDQQAVWQHMNTLQKYVKSGSPSKVEYLVDFPPSAQLLPADVREAAFPDGILPPELNIPELDTVLANCKQRGERGKSHLPQQGGKTTTKSSASNACAPGHDELESVPLPSPECFRLRADSRILPTAASSHATQLAAHEVASDGGEQQLCKKCGDALGPVGPAVAHPCAPFAPAAEVVDADEDEFPQIGLDAFEDGMMSAMHARRSPKTPKTKLKKPASVMGVAMAMKVLKKPGAVIKSGATPRKAVPGWSMQRRLKQYPDGCAKCYRKSGCTPSCFKARGQV